MLASLRMFPLLKGFRCEAAVDLVSLADCLERLSFLAMEIPEIAELDLNPVMAMTEGCAVVDARILWGLKAAVKRPACKGPATTGSDVGRRHALERFTGPGDMDKRKDEGTIKA